MDTILEQNPKIIKMLESDITQGKPSSTLGRQDTPSIEKIIRAAIYKEMKRKSERQRVISRYNKDGEKVLWKNF